MVGAAVLRTMPAFLATHLIGLVNMALHSKVLAYTEICCYRKSSTDNVMAHQLVEIPQVKVHPLVAANMMCSQFRALQQAAATAQHCEAICNDMIATAFCRAGMLCDLVASVHRAREHSESVNAALLSVLQTLECATDELYRCE